MTEYHKIETVYFRDERTHKVSDIIRNPLFDKQGKRLVVKLKTKDFPRWA